MARSLAIRFLSQSPHRLKLNLSAERIVDRKMMMSPIVPEIYVGHDVFTDSLVSFEADLYRMSDYKQNVNTYACFVRMMTEQRGQHVRFPKRVDSLYMYHSADDGITWRLKDKS